MTQRIITTAFTGTGFGATDPDYLLVVTGVDGIHQQSQLTFLHFTLTSPLVYDYRVKLVDGRVWISSITFANPLDANPIATFTVSPGWKLTEFVPQRSIRDTLIALVVRVGLTKFNIDYS